MRNSTYANTLVEHLSEAVVKLEASVRQKGFELRSLRGTLRRIDGQSSTAAARGLDALEVAGRAHHAAVNSAQRHDDLEARVEELAERIDALLVGMTELERRMNGEVPPSSKWLPLIDVADRYGVSVQTVRKWSREGIMHAAKFGDGWFVDKRTMPR